MNIELSIEQRRIILQGLWKELDMYTDMLNTTKDPMVTRHAISCINAIQDLENKLLKVIKRA